MNVRDATFDTEDYEDADVIGELWPLDIWTAEACYSLGDWLIWDERQEAKLPSNYAGI